MNFEAPDSAYCSNGGLQQNSKSKGNNQFQNKEQDCSPLLRSFSPNKNFNKGLINHQNTNNSSKGHFKTPVHNRLGNRNFQHRNNIIGDCSPTNNGNIQGPRMFNRKRRELIDGNTGPVLPKRKWVGSFYQKPNNNQQNLNLAQNRLNRIRHNSLHESTEQITEKSEHSNESQEIDATDITVEVVNYVAQAQQDQPLVRFKMVLNPKTQTAIKLIQSKRKDKQVIFPYPVTPNVTGISLHERFSSL